MYVRMHVHISEHKIHDDRYCINHVHVYTCIYVDTVHTCCVGVPEKEVLVLYTWE